MKLMSMVLINGKTNSTNSSAKSHKSGWLRKLGSKFKNWRKRYFILTEQQLCYYPSPDDLRLLGSVSLKQTTIEIPSQSNDSENVFGDVKGFLFIIKPTEPDMELSPNHSRFVLCAQTAEERTSWVRAIYKSLYLQHGGALFGTSLSEVFQYCRPEHLFLPRVVYETVEFIRENGMKAEGIFRKCGSQSMIQQLVQLYDTAHPSPILRLETHTVHVAAGLLKLYLRELPESLIPYDYYEKLLKCVRNSMDFQALSDLATVLESLPEPNYFLLHFLCKFLYEVSQYNKQNLMTVENLASVISPNVLRSPEGDSSSVLAIAHGTNALLAHLIRGHKQIFRPESRHTNRAFGTNRRQRLLRHSNAHRTLDFGDLKSVMMQSSDEHSERMSRKIEPNTYSAHFEQYEAPISQNFVTKNFERKRSVTPPPTMDEDSIIPRTPVSKRHTSLRPAYPLPTIKPESPMTSSLHRTFTLDPQRTTDYPLCSAFRKPLRHSNSMKWDSTCENPSYISSAMITIKPRVESYQKCTSSISKQTTDVQKYTLPQNFKNKTKDEYSATSFSTGLKEELADSSDTSQRISSCYDNVNIPHASCSKEHFPKMQSIGKSRTLNPPNSSNISIFDDVSERDTPSQTLEDEVEYWRNVAVRARAEAAGQRARALGLSGELTKVRCDLSIANLEIGLLQQRLAKCEAMLNRVGVNCILTDHAEFSTKK